MSRSTLTFEPGGALRSRLVSSLLAESLPTLDPGTLVGPFRVVSTLGHGGLGVVYRAQRADGAFDQQVALKLIAPEADPGIAEVLLARERRLLARLLHPNIARLLDGGRSDSGMLWFAMDHIEGERIDRWCDDRKLGLQARIRLFLDVCNAISYAHQRLVVHRDIKPSNILVDAEGTPRLLDFGIAAALDDSTDSTAPHAATPGYASPEQHRGDPAGVGQDIYQLGRLLEKLLQGIPHGRHAQDISALINHAVADQPDQRYASVDALSTDLRALLDDRPLSVRVPTPAYRLSRLLRRHRLGFSIAAMASLALALMIGSFLWHLDTQRQRAEREARTARHVSDFMIGLFRAADPALHAGNIPTVDALLAHAPAQIERELANEPAIQAELLATIGRTYVTLRDYSHAAPILQRSAQLTDALPGVSPVERAERLRVLALTLGVIEPEQARGLFLQALEGLDPDAKEHARTYNIVQQNLAMFDLANSAPEAAISRLEHALAHGRKLLGEGQPALIADLLGLGNALAHVQRYDEALAMYREAHVTARAHLGQEHPYSILAGGGLALSLAHDGQFEEATRTIDETLAITLQVYGTPSPNQALALFQAGNIQSLAGQHDKALALQQHALAISNALPIENDMLGVNVLEALGDLSMQAGDAQTAEHHYREMIARNRDNRHAQSADIGQRSIKLAQALAAQGRCDEARVSQDQARQRASLAPAEARKHLSWDAPLPHCP